MASARIGQGEDFTFKVGEGQMIEDFDQAVLGMAAGEENLRMQRFRKTIAQRNCKTRRYSFL